MLRFETIFLSLAFQNLHFFFFHFVLEPTKPKITRPDKPKTITPQVVGGVNSTIGDNITTLTNSNITINCPAVGVPPPKWSWSKDGEKITVGNKYLVQQDGTLIIRKVTVDESGTYRCTVENIAGNTTAVTHILSLGKSYEY